MQEQTKLKMLNVVEKISGVVGIVFLAIAIAGMAGYLEFPSVTHSSMYFMVLLAIAMTASEGKKRIKAEMKLRQAA
ncbi:MAG: hypothetical protein HRU19_28935 [Pseudobacteriovorax sp.]|nr:hypothetical protein [Pseudobacteriovorax sp.]